VREFGGQKMTVIVPEDHEIALSQNSPTMGRPHLVGLEWTTRGMIIDVYVLTVAKAGEIANAASSH
jgi:hypothetical protein